MANTATVTSFSLDPVAGNQSATAVVGGLVVTAIPTLGVRGAVLLMALLALGALVLMRRRTAE